MSNSIPALPAVGPFFQNLLTQVKAFPQSLKNPATVQKIENNAFNVLVAVGAVSCLLRNKIPLVVGATLGAAVQIKHNDIMKGIAPLAQKYLTLGDKQLGLLSLFMQKAESEKDPFNSEKDPFNKEAINSMLALMVVYLVSPWLGSKITAAAFGFIAVKQLYQLSQKKPATTGEVESPNFQPMVSAAKKLNFTQTEFGTQSQATENMFGPTDAQGDAEE